MFGNSSILLIDKIITRKSFRHLILNNYTPVSRKEKKNVWINSIIRNQKLNENLKNYFLKFHGQLLFNIHYRKLDSTSWVHPFLVRTWIWRREPELSALTKKSVTFYKPFTENTDLLAQNNLSICLRHYHSEK